MKLKLQQKDFLWKPSKENYGLNIGFNVNYWNRRDNNYSGTWIVGIYLLFITIRLWFDEAPELDDITEVSDE
jgi:hypothetical protein